MQILHAGLFDQSFQIACQLGEFLLHERVRAIDPFTIAFHLLIAGAHQLAQLPVIHFAGPGGLGELHRYQSVHGCHAATSEMTVMVMV